MSQGVQHMPSMYRALSSNPSSTKTNKTNPTNIQRQAKTDQMVLMGC
jgi:hypothetical protein